MQNRFLGRSLTLLFLLLFALLHSLSAQDKEEPTERELRRDTAWQHIQDLKAGTLIVRLPSNYRKIKAMQDLSESDGISPAARKRLESQLAETKQETTDRNKAIIEAFQEGFTFTKTLFMHDTAMIRLKNGANDHLFLNTDLTPANNLKRPEGPLLLMRVGKTKLEEQSRLDALVFMDEQGNDLKRPFPYYLKLNTFIYLVDRIFYPSGAFSKNIKARIEKLNRRLGRYYESVMDEVGSRG